MPRFDVQQALKDGHTEEEIQAYLKSKGVDVNGNPIKKPSTVERVSDVILNNPASQLAKWFLEPATDLARNAGGQMGMIQAIANKAVLPNKLEQTKIGQAATQGLYEKSFNTITPESQKSLFSADASGNAVPKTDPVPATKRGAELGVGNASYAIPGSGLLPKAGGKLVGPAVRVLDRAILGTGEGLLREAGEENATLESTLESGMGSGVASGAFGTVGEIGKGILKFAGEAVPERIANKVLLRKSLAETEQDVLRDWMSRYRKIDAERSGEKYADEEYKKLGGQLIKEGGMRNTVKKVFFNAEDEKRKLWKEEISPILKEYAETPISVSKIKQPVVALKDAMRASFRDEEAEKAIDGVLKNIDEWVIKYGDKNTPPAGKMTVANMETLPLRFLDEVKRQMDVIFEGVYDNKKSPELLTVSKQAQLKALTSIREAVNAQVPALKEANAKYSTWLDVQEAALNVGTKEARTPATSIPITWPMLVMGATGIGTAAAADAGPAGSMLSLLGALAIGKAMQSSTPALTTANLMNKVGTRGVSAINKIDEPAQKGIRSLTQFLMGSQQ